MANMVDCINNNSTHNLVIGPKFWSSMALIDIDSVHHVYKTILKGSRIYGTKDFSIIYVFRLHLSCLAI